MEKQRGKEMIKKMGDQQGNDKENENYDGRLRGVDAQP